MPVNDIRFTKSEDETSKAAEGKAGHPPPKKERKKKDKEEEKQRLEEKAKRLQKQLQLQKEQQKKQKEQRQQEQERQRQRQRQQKEAATLADTVTIPTGDAHAGGDGDESFVQYVYTEPSDQDPSLVRTSGFGQQQQQSAFRQPNWGQAYAGAGPSGPGPAQMFQPYPPQQWQQMPGGQQTGGWIWQPMPQT